MTGIVGYILIGVAAGILSGFFGLGGGLVIVPALIYLCGFNQLTAQGTSLAVMLPPVGVLAFMEYYKKGNVNIQAAILICITVFLGAVVGAKIAQIAPPNVLRKGFAVFMALAAIKLFISK